ncbi:MAG TPA: efflux RND transporter periplasmic adaptor subunit [Rhizomicrobium sp.]|nr:efflux RND transporter periplasmic adaptor subunit [Rhizomicrobium sp.]
MTSEHSSYAFLYVRGNRCRTLLIPVAAATLLILAGCSPSDDASKSATTPSNVTLTQEQRAHLRIYTVKQERFHRTVEAAGVVDFDNDQATAVLAPFSGPVSRLLVSAGDRVRQGQPLAIVESPDFAAAIGAYRKAAAAANAARRLANLDRDLLAHSGVAAKEADQAESDAVGAESDRDAALQALVSLNVDPQTIRQVRANRPVAAASGTIRAPLSGTVVEKLITPGELLQAGTTPCFTVADLSRVWVMSQVFGSDLDAVSVGDSARISTGERDLSGRVENVAAEVDPNTRSIAVRVVVDNPRELLKKQMYVRVQIQARRESSGLLVPVSAILRDDQNLPFVYLALADGSFARSHVTLGDRTGDSYDIREGLKPGERVVVDGALFVQFVQDQ